MPNGSEEAAKATVLFGLAILTRTYAVVVLLAVILVALRAGRRPGSRCGRSIHRRGLWTTTLARGTRRYSSSESSCGIWKSRRESSSTFTSLNVSTRTLFTKRSARYTSHTHTSDMVSSK